MTLEEFSQTVRTAAFTISMGNPASGAHLGENPAYYTKPDEGGLSWCGRIHLDLAAMTKPERYKFLSAVLKRKITSTKQISLAEAIAIHNSRKHIKDLTYDQKA